MKIERTTVFSCNDLPEKEKRNLAIYNLIRTKGQISKPEISKATGINIVSVSNYIENYIARKLISERESAVSSGGRKPELVELNRTGCLVAGVEVSGSVARAVVTDLGGDAIAAADPVTAGGADPAAVAAASESAVRAALKKAGAGTERLGAVGVSTSDKKQAGVGELLSAAFGIAAYAGPAAQCAAFGERALNAGVADGTMLYLHSDLGTGIVLKDDACYGIEGSPAVSGEYEEEERYLRPWSEALGIVPMAKAQVQRGIGTKVVAGARGNPDNISVEAVIAAARDKDRVAMDILQTAGLSLGIRAAYLVNLFGPATVVIGGGIDKAGAFILDPVQRMVKRFSRAKEGRRVRVIAGSLGDDAASLGAAVLAAREMFVRS